MSTFRLNFVPRNLGLFGQRAVAKRTLDLHPDTNFHAWHVHALDLLLPYIALHVRRYSKRRLVECYFVYNIKPRANGRGIAATLDEKMDLHKFAP